MGGSAWCGECQKHLMNRALSLLVSLQTVAVVGLSSGSADPLQASQGEDCPGLGQGNASREQTHQTWICSEALSGGQVRLRLHFF